QIEAPAGELPVEGGLDPGPGPADAEQALEPRPVALPPGPEGSPWIRLARAERARRPRNLDRAIADRAREHVPDRVCGVRGEEERPRPGRFPGAQERQRRR